MNALTEPVSTTRAGKQPIWRWVLLGAIALIAIGAVLSATHRSPPLPPIILFPPGYKIPQQKVPIPDRWMPRSWGWLWRMKARVLGQSKVITIGASIVELTAPPQEVLSGFAIGEPTFTNSNGLHVWITDKSVFRALENSRGGTGPPIPGFREAGQFALPVKEQADKNFRVVASPRITTADGMHARLSSTTSVLIGGAPTSVGVVLDLLPRVRQDSTDLTAILTYTEAVTNPAVETVAQSFGTTSVQTNLSVAARIQIPKGHSVLMLDARPSAEDGKIHGLIISANSVPANALQQKAVLRQTITRVGTPPSPPRP